MCQSIWDKCLLFFLEYSSNISKSMLLRYTPPFSHVRGKEGVEREIKQLREHKKICRLGYSDRGFWSEPEYFALESRTAPTADDTKRSRRSIRAWSFNTLQARWLRDCYRLQLFLSLPPAKNIRYKGHNHDAHNLDIERTRGVHSWLSSLHSSVSTNLNSGTPSVGYSFFFSHHS